MLNLLIYTWPALHACHHSVIEILSARCTIQLADVRQSAGVCFASLLGFIQVMLQWLLFSIMYVPSSILTCHGMIADQDVAWSCT